MSVFSRFLQQFWGFQRNARLYLISNALSGVTIGILLVLYNLYLLSLGYGTAFIGLIFFCGALGGGLAIFPAGYCINYISNKALMIWSSLLIGLAGAGQILFRTPIPLEISSFVVGVGGAVILVVNAPYLTTNSTSEERPALFSLNIVLILIMTVVGEALGGILPDWFHALAVAIGTLPSWCAWCFAHTTQARAYQLSLLLAGAIALPSFVPLFLLTEEQRPLPSLSPLLWAREHIQKASRVRWRGLSDWSRQITGALVVLSLVQIFIGFGLGLFAPYFNVYFVDHLKGSSALFGIIDGVANILIALFTLCAPWCVKRFGSLMTIILPRLLSIPVMLVIGFTHSLPVALLCYPFSQSLMNMSSGILQVFSMESVSPQQRGLANSSYQASYQVANAIGSSLGGVIIARLGFPLAFVCAAVLFLAALLLLLLRFRVSVSDQRSGQNVSLDEHPEQLLF